MWSQLKSLSFYELSLAILPCLSVFTDFVVTRSVLKSKVILHNLETGSCLNRYTLRNLAWFLYLAFDF